ncbi:hypothetical protein B5E41_29135 [Rhizobium esperanzae]|uniref:Uncharacterized protein n=1 Tax=Rhizobium esperanzae TaxID=1967781 RepID=A0A246DL83_9HYPH|nr:hypothetical protein [Rhizobium esperanzae]OWO89993.1 hypothetical protein B5E41_29135 [Rhizobium esperanzae]
MAAEKEKAIDYSKIAEALNKLAETPNPKSKTLADHLREPSVKEAIERAKAAGYRSDAIVPLLAELGIKTTTASFDATWSKLKREDRGETGTKPEGKSRSTSRKNNPAKPLQTASEKVSESGPDAGAEQAGTGGDKSKSKSLNKSPTMGGAFNENDL